MVVQKRELKLRDTRFRNHHSTSLHLLLVNQYLVDLECLLALDKDVRRSLVSSAHDNLDYFMRLVEDQLRISFSLGPEVVDHQVWADAGEQDVTL